MFGWDQKCSVAESLKQLYLKKDVVNQPDVLYADKGSRKVNFHCKHFDKVRPSMLWVNQASRLINKLYIKLELMNQFNFLHEELLLINETAVT